MISRAWRILRTGKKKSNKTRHGGARFFFSHRLFSDYRIQQRRSLFRRRRGGEFFSRSKIIAVTGIVNHQAQDVLWHRVALVCCTTFSFFLPLPLSPLYHPPFWPLDFILRARDARRRFWTSRSLARRAARYSFSSMLENTRARRAHSVCNAWSTFAISGCWLLASGDQCLAITFIAHWQSG